jgi:hypothetical protein
MTLMPPGSFAPTTGIKLASEFFCPAGTFSTLSGLTAQSQCQACPAGSYCQSAGIVAPTGSCMAGFHCISGASSPTPTDGVTGLLCPLGKICLAGTVSPALCPPGTLAPPTLGNAAFSACLRCPATQYCDLFGASAASGPCAAGYVCTGGANASVPTTASGYPCVAGYYCPSGTTGMLQCQAGSYNPDLARSSWYGRVDFNFVFVSFFSFHVLISLCVCSFANILLPA